MLPITELRLTVPLGVLKYDLDWPIVALISILGNFLICIPIITLLKSFDELCSKYKILSSLLNKIYIRTRSKTKIISNYKYLGLIFFVGIPLPFTGAWTGCFASHLLGLNKKKTLISIFIGLLISSSLIISIILFAQNLLSWIGYAPNN
tara:strand:- start:1968 stop:2414 length:447 start_codon:yes stop_codon:yes gene_type:complete